jgi:hypothetical protein
MRKRKNKEKRTLRGWGRERRGKREGWRKRKESEGGMKVRRYCIEGSGKG